jgi:hypothetical protein
MTARSSRQSSAVAKKSARQRAPAPAHERESDRSGWPGVVRYALENWPCTVRLCVIVVVAGVVLAALIVLRLRLWL